MESKPQAQRLLVVNASPHRAASTTLLATNAFVEGMQKDGAYTCETLHLSSLRITPCTGCLSCWGRTEGECVIKNDDVPMLKQKILEADVILCSFPLYYFGMPGQMKVALDRLLSLVYAYHGQNAPTDGSPAHEFRYPMEHKRLILLSGCAYNETDVVYEPIRWEFDLICGVGNYIALFCPQFKTMADHGGSRLSRILSRFTAAGEELARTGSLSPEAIAAATRPPFSPDTYRTILENVWRQERERGGAEDAQGEDS